MNLPLTELGIYAFLWTLFGMVHSGMASLTFKRWITAQLAGFACMERLIFNVVSSLVFLPVMIYGHLYLPTTLLLQPAPPWLLLILQGIGVWLLLWSLSTYDLPRFAGVLQLRQCRQHLPLTEEPLVLSTLHQHVRHPIYASLLLILWARTWDVATLATNVCATLYLLIGIHLEEQKLLLLYGQAYDRIRQSTPKLVPKIRLRRT
ncbi:MAG: hypothetical protein G8345_08585 [Magnetococcales bacterium]|nr:hypothetical protein [Magnetococcales bacterium]NGZ26931.1 hypothetical protein [Magnetococcales bacterium]